MKKRMVTTMALCVAIAAQAYWSGSPGATTHTTEGKFYYTTGGVDTYFDTFYLDSGGTFSVVVNGMMSPFSSLSVGTYSFYAQVVDGDRTWTSDTLEVSVYDNYGMNGITPEDHQFTGTWSGAASESGAGSVPEPTSGLLLLLGFAGLALKRKRA